MKAPYQLTPTPTVGPAAILRVADGAYIPANPSNIDYAAYQAWLAVPGNTPDPAPVPPPPPTGTP